MIIRTKKFKKKKITIENFDEVKVKKKKVKLKAFSQSKIVKTSRGEAAIANWLVKNKIKFIREKQFQDLINPETGCQLSFDFYLFGKATCIEFDGKQHFEESKSFDRKGDTLNKRIYRDSLKDIYCATKGIKLIRIKYTFINEVAEILKTHFG